MRATEVIETYIDDTVRLLPRRLRADVATELRSLLNEELLARAEESGRPPDESLALSLVRGYGQPNEVAARYQTPWTIAVQGNIFQSSLVDRIACDVLALVAAIYIPCVGIMLYGEIGRLHHAAVVTSGKGIAKVGCVEL